MPRSSSISSTKRKHLLFGIRRSVAYCEYLADGSSATVDGGRPVNCLPRGGEEQTLMLDPLRLRHHRNLQISDTDVFLNGATSAAIRRCPDRRTLLSPVPKL
jgi:hypothetical protein